MKLKIFPAPLAFFIIMLFAFTAYSMVDVWRLNQEIKMPEQFLGYWKPYSRGRANVGIEIFPNGAMHDVVNDKSREVLERTLYEVIRVDKEDKNKVYVVMLNTRIDIEGNITSYYDCYLLMLKPSYMGVPGDLLSFYRLDMQLPMTKDWKQARLGFGKMIEEYRSYRRQYNQINLPYNESYSYAR